MNKFFEGTMNMIIDLLYTICCILCFGFKFTIAGYFFLSVIVIRAILQIYANYKEEK